MDPKQFKPNYYFLYKLSNYIRESKKDPEYVREFEEWKKQKRLKADKLQV